MSPELKPCPFCGGVAIDVLPPNCRLEDPYDAGDRLYPIASCRGCNATVAGDDEDHLPGSPTARDAWNRRTFAQPKQATPTVEAVEDEVGMGHGAWDMVDAKEIISAVLRLATCSHEHQTEYRSGIVECDFCGKQLPATARPRADTLPPRHEGFCTD